MEKMPPTAALGLETQISRKVTRKIIPLLMLGMFVAQIDRANLGVIAGPLSKDLGLTTATFGLAAGFFYIGYLLFEVPSNMMLARVGARVWLGRIMVSWGIVTVLMAFMQNETWLHVMRFLLGVAEAGYIPGAILLLALWCPPGLLPKAISWMNLAVPVAYAVGTIVTSSILLMDGVAGVAGWRWVYVLEGIPAVLIAILIFFALPSVPGKAAWLDADEKAYLGQAVTQRAGAGGHELKQLASALRRPSSWAFAITLFCMMIGFWSITYFLPTIVKEQLKLDAVYSGYVSAVPWVLSAIFMFVNVRSIARTGERRWHLTLPQVAAAIGLLVGVVSGNPYLSLLGVSLAAAGFSAVISTFQATVAQVYAGAIAAVTIALVNSVGNLSGFAGPYLLGSLNDITGSTGAGLLVMSGFFAVAAILTYLLIGWADRKTGGLEGNTPSAPKDAELTSMP